MNAASELGQIVQTMVASYARRCRWADEDELRGEAWLAAMEAYAKWNPERGPLGPYAGTSVKRAVGNYLMRMSSPVSATNRSTDRRALVGTSRASEAVALTLSTPRETWADALLEDARWRIRVVARLLEVIGDETAEPNLNALTTEIRSTGRPPNWLLDLKQETREKIAADEELRGIWKEREP